MNIEHWEPQLKRYLQIQLNKKQSTEITQEELDTIEEITIDKQKEDNELQILGHFPNIKDILIRGFTIQEQESKILNSLSYLTSVQLEDCTLQKGLRLTGNIEYLFLVQCNDVSIASIETLPRLKVLEIHGGKNITIKGIQHLKLEELALTELKIENIEEIIQIEGLKRLNLNGSKIKKRKLLERIVDQVEIEQEKQNDLLT